MLERALGRAVTTAAGLALFSVLALASTPHRSPVRRPSPLFGHDAALHAAVREAAAACGVVAFENAPATVRVLPDTGGAIETIDVRSPLFGGVDADDCIRARLRADPAAAGRGGARVLLPVTVPEPWEE